MCEKRIEWCHTPFDQAYVVSSATMTNMNMVAPPSHVTAVGRGTYLARFRLYMAGPWAITITVHVIGFTLLYQTVFMQMV